MLSEDSEMANQRDEIRPYGQFDDEIQKLAKLFVELGIEVNFESDLHQQGFAAFRALYYSVYSTEGATISDWDKAKDAGALAGLGDLAFKINRAALNPAFQSLRPHLRNMLAGSVRMNASAILDEASNKNCELYVGCLALGAGLTVDMEDPKHTGGGKNPDVLLRFRERDWSIAVKASQVRKARTIFGAIEKAVDQIEQSGRHGIVVVNLKNILSHDDFGSVQPYPSPDAAIAAVTSEIEAIMEEVRSGTTEGDWRDLFEGKLARPLVAFMGQVTAPAHMPGVAGRVFVPVKTIRVLPVVDAVQRPLTGLNAEAWDMLAVLNEELQLNPGP
jgi:hypothetical protein